MILLITLFSLSPTYLSMYYRKELSARRKGSRWKHRKKVETLRDPELDPSPLVERKGESRGGESPERGAFILY